VTRTDANGSTWFHLGTETDFLPAGGADAAFGPAFGPGVSYDPDRHVLELTSELPRRRRRSPPGLAVDPGGDLYLVAGGTLLVERCDGSRAPLPCEPGILRDPHGLALDRRGLLYVADRGARSVVVLQPDDGRVEARLEAPGLHEPVDVAIAPSGDVFVADRGGHDLIGLAAGRIWRFGARFELLGSWVPQDGAVPPRPLRPRPIAVLWDAGDVLVADEAHPRLLAFDAAGRPRLEREYTAAADEARRRFGSDPPDGSWYAAGTRAALATSGRCGPSAGVDPALRLAEVHGALRLLHLTAGGRFRTDGEWTSAVLDAGLPGPTWHRIDLDVELPPGTSIGVETATSEDRAALADPPWDVLRDRDGNPLLFTGTPAAAAKPLEYDAAATAARIREQLVQSPPGRFLRLRVRLEGDGGATPSLHALRVYHPRHGYREDLPAVWSREPGPRAFLDGFLSLFERVLTRIEDARDDFYRLLRPAAAPPDVLAWLAALLDLTFDPSWPLPRRRALVAEASDLYRHRGTPGGIVRYVELYAGIRPVVTETFRLRPDRATTAGRGVLGASFGVGLGAPGPVPDEELFRAYAHRFTVHLPLPDPCDEERMLAVVDRIVTVNKPAHTFHTLELVAADARLGLQSTVGVDLIPGVDPVHETRLAPETSTPVLGLDTVLGPRRPYPTPPDHTL